MPSVYVYHFSISLVLYLSTVPLALYFILNIHLQPMVVFYFGGRVISHVWFDSKVDITHFIAFQSCFTTSK